MRRTRATQTVVSVVILTGLMTSFFVASTPPTEAQTRPLIVGYVASWNVSGSAQAASLPGNKFTHLIYAFIGIDTATQTCTASWEDYEQPAEIRTKISADQMAAIVGGLRENKVENPDLKILLSIGGGGYAARFNAIWDYNTFASSCVELMATHKADGIDVDYEFPSDEAGTDRMNKIVSAMHTALNNSAKGWSQNGLGTGNKLLTVGAAAGPFSGKWQDVATLKNYVDYFTTMAYNYHGSWETGVHFNSPMSGCGIADAFPACMLGTGYYWNTTRGVSLSKLLMGVGFYGNEYATSAGCGVALGSSGYTSLKTVDYKQLRSGTYADSSWTRGYSDSFNNAYQCKSGTWIGYENTKSVKARADQISKDGYRGIMIWEVFKDYNYELLNEICAALTCPAPAAATATASRTATTASAPTVTRTRTATVQAPTATRTRTATTVAAKTATPDGSGNGTIPAWSPNSISYRVGDRVTYGGKIYRCAYAHSSQQAWNPVDWPGGWTLETGTVPTATAPSSALGTPQNVTAVARSSSSIEVSWSGVSGATGYQVLRCVGGGCTPSTVVASPSSTTYTDSGLSAGTTYVYRVKAMNSSSSSALSSTASATTQAASATRTRTATIQAPSAPTATRTATTSGVSPWQVGVYYAQGSRASYGGRIYQATQPHTAQAGWEPPNVPAIWSAQ